MYNVDLDMSNIEWENEECKEKYYDYVESELDNIMESCCDSAECYVNESSDSMGALLTVRDNETTYSIYDPETRSVLIATVWYQVEISI